MTDIDMGTQATKGKVTRECRRGQIKDCLYLIALSCILVAVCL